MLSKNKIKLIQSLDSRKSRKETACFLAEGNKLVADLLPFFDCELLLARASWLATQGDIKAKELIVAEDGDIEKASLQKNPQDVLAIFRQPVYDLCIDDMKARLSLVLDGIQDPGNLGTIIRMADWFGIEDIVCSPDTADVFNPKVIQATMGALARVRVHYTELPEFLAQFEGLPVYGTFLDGENMYDQNLSANGLIVMGNEGGGIRKKVEDFVTERLFIPNYPLGKDTSESLNVSVATAVVCAEFRRQQVYSV